MRRFNWASIIVTVLVFLVPMVALAAPALKVGDSGWKIKVAQQKLNVIGFKTTVNGKFTKDMENSLKDFQRKYKLKVTGFLDDATYDRVVNEAFVQEGIQGVTGKQIVSSAKQLKGIPYKFGGTTTKAFDCSGYVQYIFAKYKAKMPRLADAQALEGIFVLRKNLKEGDLVFFTTYEAGASHVGIYAGKDKFWHVSTSKGVILSSLSEPYWAQRYFGARRVLVDAGK